MPRNYNLDLLDPDFDDLDANPCPIPLDEAAKLLGVGYILDAYEADLDDPDNFYPKA